MSGTNSFAKSVPLQALVIAFVAVTIFYFSAPGVDDVRDIEISKDGRYAYLAIGERGVRVLDISDPEMPRELEEFDTFGSANGLDLQDDKLFVADANNGLLVLDVSNPENVTQIWRYDESKNALDVVVKGKFAYLADGSKGLYVLKTKDLPPPEDEDFVWHDDADGIRRIVYYGNQAYAVRGDNTLLIFNIKEPQDTKEINSIEVGSKIGDLAVWGGKVFLAAEGQGLGWIKKPDASTEKLDGTFPIEGQIRSLDVQGKMAYLGIWEKGLEILDISKLSQVESIAKEDDPRQPTALNYHKGYIYVGDGRKGLNVVRVSENLEFKEVAQGDEGQGLMGSVEDVTIHKDGYIYLASCQQGIQVIEPEKEEHQEQYFVKEAPGCAVAIDTSEDFLVAAYQNKGVRVYGIEDNFITPELVSDISTDGAANDVDIKDHYAYVANGEAGLKIVDWELPVNQVIGEIEFDDGADAQGVFVLGDYAYVAAGSKGLQVVDISDPTKPSLESSFKTSVYARSVHVEVIEYADEDKDEKDIIHAYVVGGEKDKTSGLWVIDVSDSEKPSKIAEVKTSAPVLDVTVDGRLVYVLVEGQGLKVYDVIDPKSPQDKSPEPVEGKYSSLTIADHQVYVGRKDQGMQILKVDDPDNPEVVASFSGVGDVHDAVVVDHFLYTVDGLKGMWIIDSQDPENLSPVEFYGTKGEAQAVSAMGKKAFIADGSKGFRIVDVGDDGEVTEVGFFDALDDTVAVAVKGNYAYVTNAKREIVIFDIKDSNKIKEVNKFETWGPVLDISIVGNYIFLAEGESGIQVLNITDQDNPSVDTFASDEEISNAQVILTTKDPMYLYVAEGSAGLRIFDIEKPSEAKLVASFESEDSITDIFLMDDYIFAADGEGGARVFYIQSEQDIYEMDGVEGDVRHAYGIDLSPGKALHFHVLVAHNEEWLRVYKAEKKVELKAMGWYETPGKATIAELLLRGANPQRTREAQLLVVGGIGGYFLATLVFLALFSGLILPVEARGFSRDVFSRLIAYMRGRHGPVVFAEDGKQTEREGQFRDVGPGFVRIDACSAVVIERRAYQPGCIGGILLALLGRHPRENLRMRTADVGINFTRPGERVRGVADIRRQIRLRPGVSAHTRDGIEVNCVVFALFTLGEPPDVYKVTYAGDEKPENLCVIETKLQDPGQEDGQFKVQVVEKLVDILDPEDKFDIHRFVQSYRRRAGLEVGETVAELNGWRPFWFSPQRVFAAIASRPYDVLEEKRKDWAELPAHIAVNAFRGLLSQQLYDSLFLVPKPYPLLDFKNELRRCLVNQGILAYRFVERIDGKEIEIDQELRENQLIQYPEREFIARKVLRSRGIKVITAGFTELKPTISDVQGRYMFDHWRAPWQQEAIIVQSDHELQATRMKNQARAQAQRDMAYTLSKILSASEFSREAMALRVFQALETAAADPATQRLLPRETIDLMRSLRNLLLPGESSFF